MLIYTVSLNIGAFLYMLPPRRCECTWGLCPSRPLMGSVPHPQTSLRLRNSRPQILAGPGGRWTRLTAKWLGSEIAGRGRRPPGPV